MASGGLILLLGFALFFNVAVIMWKFQQGMETNAFIDGAVLGAIFWLFSGTMSALAIGTIASAMFSVYLIFVPFEEGEKSENEGS